MPFTGHAEWRQAVCDYLEASEAISQWEEVKHDARKVMEGLLGDATCGEGEGARVYWRPASRKTKDAKGMARRALDLAQEVETAKRINRKRLVRELKELAEMTRSTTTRPFRLYPV